MAATNPFRVSDLISKYGWKVMPYLSNLGSELLAEAQVLFVDSGHTNASDADDTEHGHSFEMPLATIDYAIGLCTAGERSVILAAPGHNDVLGDAQIDFDVSDVTLIGIGDGTNKPTIDFDHANSSVDIGANNVTIRNIDFLPSITDVLIGVHVETGVLGFKMVDCNFRIGEDDAGVDEFIKAVELTSGNDDCIFENVKILAHASAAGATHGIHIAAASDRLTFKNVIIDGPYATGGIVEAAAGVNQIVENCAVDVSGVNFSFHNSSTFARRVNNIDGQDPNALEPISNYSQALLAHVLRSVAGSSFPHKFWWVDGNASDDTGDGKTPATAKKTITAALTLCEDTQEDWIFVRDYSGSTNEITIANAFVHLIGYGNPGMPYPRIQASTSGEAGFVLGNAADRVEIANFMIASTGTAAGIEFNGSAGSYDCWIHDCQFGRVGNTCGQDGINVGAGVGGAAPYLVVENCKFGTQADDTIVRDGIKIANNATGAIIRNNTFAGVGGICVNLAGSCESVSVLDNTMSLKADGIGDAVDVSSGCSRCMVSGNRAMFGDNYITSEVFRDQGTGNEFGQNDDGQDWRTHRMLDAWFSYANRSVVGSAFPRRFWYVDANISASGNGRTPDTAFKTIAEAIAVCTNSSDDWVFVFDYSGGGTTIIIDTAYIHLIGNMGFAMPYPRIKPSSGAGIELQDGADRVEICGFTIGAADTSNAAILFDGDSAAGAYGCYIHDNVIGRDADAPCLYGIQIASGGAAPYLRISNNRFIGAGGTGIAAAGSAILFTGNATRCVIEGNRILDVGKTATPAIWLAGGITEPTIIGNHIKYDTDTGSGSAITLGASVDDGWVADNYASDGKDTPSNSPYADAASTNGWSGNRDGDGFAVPG